jgi:hypothetical protein
MGVIHVVDNLPHVNHWGKSMKAKLIKNEHANIESIVSTILVTHRQ